MNFGLWIIAYTHSVNRFDDISFLKPLAIRIASTDEKYM